MVAAHAVNLFAAVVLQRAELADDLGAFLVGRRAEGGAVVADIDADVPVERRRAPVFGFFPGCIAAALRTGAGRRPGSPARRSCRGTTWAQPWAHRLKGRSPPAVSPAAP